MTVKTIAERLWTECCILGDKIKKKTSNEPVSVTSYLWNSLINVCGIHFTVDIVGLNARQMSLIYILPRMYILSSARDFQLMFKRATSKCRASIQPISCHIRYYEQGTKLHFIHSKGVFIIIRTNAITVFSNMTHTFISFYQRMHFYCD